MATTTNFGWETPDDTDLVKDGALAMRTLGNSIDSSFVDLKGGTTGQVLAKASNTDLDYTWVTQDDANAIQNAIVDAKGDLIAASAADTPARLAVGANGETLVADSSASTGLRWQSNFAAGKNKIINGDFGIWQRGTSFSNPSSGSFVADRFKLIHDGTGATRTVSQQTFTPGTAPVAGYEGQFFLRYAVTVAGTGNNFQGFFQPVEDVRTFAGQTITISFWAKAAANTTISYDAVQNFGSGGSSEVFMAGSPTAAVTTSWQRFSFTGSLPSVAGKTIGTGSFVRFGFYAPANATSTVDFWGVQVEAGNTATAFQTATGTLAGELQAAQRYYQRMTSAQFGYLGSPGFAASTSQVLIQFPTKTTMRIVPTSLDFSGLSVSPDGINTGISVSSAEISGNTKNADTIILGLNVSGATQFRPYLCYVSNSTGHLGVSAEL